MVGGHQGFDCSASFLMTPPKAGCGAGSCLPLIVVVALAGIAPDVARRLFTPFFTTRSEGMGLGLSLCRTVIEQHGGALDYATSASGTGFVFTLRTP